jgi:signal transduction histidine kinase
MYYFLIIAQITNIALLISIISIFIIFAGIIMAKLSIDPLQEYTQNLQTFSYETLHELNLPLSTIQTNLGMLKKGLKNEKDIKRAQRIASACDMLQERYNELDYMIKSQSLSIVKERFDLAQLVKSRLEFLNRIYPHFEFNMQLETTHILNDKVGLSKVIDNLIDNGVKYSQNIHKIDIQLHDNEISIKDYGLGMDEVELVQIFDNYYQSNKNSKGFGIGLSMVKRFCDNNNILLNIDSKPKLGTTIRLKFKAQDN